MRFSKILSLDVSPSGNALYHVTIVEANGYQVTMQNVTASEAAALQGEVIAKNLVEASNAF